METSNKNNKKIDQTIVIPDFLKYDAVDSGFALV
jgi:hypothetical protein